MNTCRNCHRSFVYSHDKGHTKDLCGSCRVAINRLKLKNKAIEYLGGKCSICGYNKCNRALSFHHRNILEKEFSFGSNKVLSWERLKKELDKCDLLCSNCHMEEHDRVDKLNNTLAYSSTVRVIVRYTIDASSSLDMLAEEKTTGSSPVFST